MITRTETFDGHTTLTETDDGVILRQEWTYGAEAPVNAVSGPSMRRANVRLSDGAVSVENIPTLLKAYETIIGRPGWRPDGNTETAEAFLLQTRGYGVLHARTV